MISSADKAVLALSARPETGGIQTWAKWFFDTSVLAKQFAFTHAPQPNVIELGGVGSGKTMGVSYQEAYLATMIPYCKILNTSITSGQAELAFNMLEPRIRGNKRFLPYIEDILLRPYPTIKFVNGAEITYRTAGYEARNIRGFEFDCINFDEGGYEPRKSTMQFLRGRLRGRRPDNTARLNRLSITTTPTDVPWLIDMWEKGHPDEGDEYDPYHYCSIRTTTYDNTFLTEGQIAEIVRDYSDAMIQQEVMAQFPDYGDTEFSRASIELCETLMMNDLMELATRGPQTNDPHWRPEPGWSVIEHPRHGILYWQIPPQTGHRYVMAGDPGSASPPKRNSGVVGVFDVTNDPYELVYFHWVDGHGSLLPFLRSYKGALDAYEPIFCGLDTTGPQKSMEELAFAEHGINVDKINFQRDKDAMVNALKWALSKGQLRFPVIKGMHSQLRAYKRDEDKKMQQDIIAMLMQIPYLCKFLPTTVELGNFGTLKRRNRNIRSGRTRRRR